MMEDVQHAVCVIRKVWCGHIEPNVKINKSQCVDTAPASNQFQSVSRASAGTDVSDANQYLFNLQS